MTLTADLLGILNDDFATETVIYEPYLSAPRAVSAVINRSPDTVTLSGGSEIAETIFAVTISNDPILGIAAPTPGKDRIHLKRHLGDTVLTVCRVSAILSEDAAGYTLQAVQ